MKIPILFFHSCVLSAVFSPWAQAQTTKTDSPPAALPLKVGERRTVPLKDGSGRQLVLERIEPPAITPFHSARPSGPVHPQVSEARRAVLSSAAKKERRILSLTGIYYPGGQTLLKWNMPSPEGSWEAYEAWTLTDFRSVALVGEFEVGDTIYNILPSIYPASKWDTGRLMPGPLYFPKESSGYRLIKGDPNRPQAMAPVEALHVIYKQEGPALAARWLGVKARQEADAAWLKANPPPVKNIRVRFWPGKNITAKPSPSTAPKAGENR